MTSRSQVAEGNRLRRALARIAAGLGLGVVFVGSLAAGVVIHLDLPPARRQVERFVRSALDGVFDGEVEVRGFEHVGLDGIALREVIVRAPGGGEVLHATGVRARASVPTIVRGVLGSGDLHLGLPYVRIETVDVLVEPNDRGELGIAAAFNPRATGEAGPGRPLHFKLAHAEIGALHAHGKPDGEQPIDADLQDVAGSIRIDPGDMAIDLVPMRVTERAILPRPIAGSADFHLWLRGPKKEGDPTPSTTGLSASFAGHAGDVGVVAIAMLDGQHLEATAVVPRALPEEVRAIVPKYPLIDAASVSVTARGDLPNLDVWVSALTDRNGSVTAQGQVLLAKRPRVDLTFAAEGVDPRAALESGPAIKVTARGKVHADIGPSMFVRVEATTDPTSLDGTPVPGVDAIAVLDGTLWNGLLKVDEPGAPTTVSFSTRDDGALVFDVKTEAASLAKVPRLDAAKLRGLASVHVAGTVLDGALDAAVDGHVHALRVGATVAVEHATVKGNVRGPLDALVVDATVKAVEAHAGTYGAEAATIHVKGPVVRPEVRAHVLDFRHNVIDVSAIVDTKTSAAERMKVRVERDGTVASGRITRVGMRGGALAIDGIAIEGADFGKVAGSLRVVGGELLGDLRAEGIDLAAVRKFVGLPRTLEGKVDVAVKLARAKGGRTGTVHLALHDVGGDVVPAMFLNGVSARLDATFEGDRVQASGDAQMTGRGGRCASTIAKLSLAGGEGHLTGPLLSARTWEGAIGHVTIAAEDWDLACLAEAAPFPLPLSEIFGIVSAKLTLDRPEKQRFPSIHDLGVTTRYLSITGPESAPATASAAAVPPWYSHDIDLDLSGEIDGATGEAALHVKLWDEALLANGSVFTTLDLGALLDAHARDAALRKTEVAGRFTVPRRQVGAFRTLPSFVRDKLPALGGEASIDAYVTGTADHPSAVVRVMGWNVSPPENPVGEDNPWALPVDLDAAAAYGGDHAMLDAHLLRGGGSLARAEASLTVPLAKIVAGGPDLLSSIAGRAEVTLDGLPLGDLPAFGDRAVSGDLRGRASLEDIGKEPRLTLDLQADGLQIGPDLAFSEARVSVHTKRGATPADATALATIHFADRAGGSFDAGGYVNVDWRSGLVPVPREDRPADVYARFRRFRLATAEPFIGGVVRDLDGFVNGDIRAGWGNLENAKKASLDADLTIEDARFHIPQLGQELRLVGDETGPLRIRADRTGTVRVEHLVARGNNGKVVGEAVAHLDGLTFKDATGKLTIAENEPLPITLEGAEIGAIWGNVALASTNAVDPETRASVLSLDLRSSDLHLKIPSSSSRDVQSLDKNPDIVVLQDRVPPEEPGSQGAGHIRLVARLENMVIEGEGMRVTLSSFEKTPPTIVMTDKAHAGGDIRLLRGTISVMGRKFELDQGTVHLRDDPSNPYLDVTAHWDAPDGSTIFVDYSGVLLPITQDKLRFRSDPARTQQQSLAMLLFGSETGGELTSSDTSASKGTFGTTVEHAAADLGGELAAQQFNALLKGIAPLKGLSTRFGTTEAGGVKTSLVYQVGDTLSAVATYEGGAPSGTAGATTTSGGTSTTAPGASVSVDWRFYKNWLIRATVGTSADIPRGEVDLLWQYRY